jgi:adenine-specific DNA methylase
MDIFNEYGSYNSAGEELQQMFTDLLREPIREAMKEHSRADIFYTLSAAADWILVVEAITGAVTMRKERRENG